jgi:hypothetical protein
VDKAEERKELKALTKLWRQLDEVHVFIANSVILSATKVLETQSVYRFNTSEVRNGFVLGNTIRAPRKKSKSFLASLFIFFIPLTESNGYYALMIDLERSSVLARTVAQMIRKTPELKRKDPPVLAQYILGLLT